jgi:Fur family ferric uptake transcriptional regulator
MAVNTGQRMTKQQTAVADALAVIPDFLSAQELHRQLVDSGTKISLATVYRVLTQLTEEGRADSVRREDGEAVYRQCAVSVHHHHIVCEQCGTAVEIETPEVEQLVEKSARAHGFTQVRHTMEIFGVCSDCSAAVSAS